MREFKFLRGYEEKRVFHIDVGNLDGDVEYFTEQLRRAMSIPAAYFRREMLNEPLQVTEDIFIPVRNNEL